MRFNLEQLRAFTLSVDQGSFSAAARQLGKAQSAVSTAISNLELDLGLTLFDRSRREPTLTEAGRTLLPQAQALLAQARLFEGHADAMSAGEEGRLSLAVEESLMGDTLETVLVQLETEFPQLELELLTPARSDIINLISQGRVDIGLMISTEAPPQDFRIRPLREMIMVAVASPTHPLAAFEALSFEQLMAHRQLVLTSREGDVLVTEQLSRKIWKIESQYGLLELVKRSLGWAWAPQHMVAPMIEEGSLQRLRLGDNVERYHRLVDLITSANYQEGKAGQWLCQQLSELAFLR